MTIHKLLPLLKKSYPSLQFVKGDGYIWSPKTNTITYTSENQAPQHAVWALLHETAHADFSHRHYTNDVELLRYESAAWQRAQQIAKELGETIDIDHIEDCLDTYRDWLHRRATCPTCSVVAIQQSSGTYHCFNCQTSWDVPSSPLCKIQRRIRQIKN